MSITTRLCITTLALLLSAPPIVGANPPEGDVKTIERFSLILYDFDSAEPGTANERILSDYVLPSIDSTTEISIAGFSDVVGQEEHNYRLALARATKIADRIRRKMGAKGFKSLVAAAHREEEAPYRYELAEGRMYSRTVVITLTKRGG